MFVVIKILATSITLFVMIFFLSLKTFLHHLSNLVSASASLAPPCSGGGGPSRSSSEARVFSFCFASSAFPFSLRSCQSPGSVPSASDFSSIRDRSGGLVLAVVDLV